MPKTCSAVRSTVFSLSLLVALPLVVPSDAQASISIAVTFDTLVERADAAMLVAPVDANSVWEGKRIVTYTKLRVEKSIAGTGASEVTVKTLGGSVGNIGQAVSGEPVFRPGEQSIVFLRKIDNAFVVVERAQGQYPVALDATKQRLITRRAADVGALVPVEKVNAEKTNAAKVAPGLQPTRYPGSLAQDVLIHRPADDVMQDIVDAWPKRHPAK